MAIAGIALTEGFRSRIKFKGLGGGLLGSAVGTAIGIGAFIYDNYDLTSPFSDILQPDRTKKGTPFLDASQTYVSANKFSQTFRTKNKQYGRKRSRKRSNNCRCCQCC